MKTIRDIGDEIMARFAEAELKPRLKCQRCGKFEALDIAWNDPPICEPCGTDAERKSAEQQSLDKFHERRKASAFPPRFYKARFADFTECAADPRYSKHQQAVARRVFECCQSDSGKGILLIGPSSTGKTHLLAAAANKILVHKPLLWLDGNSLKRQLAADTFAKSADALDRPPFGQRVAAEFSAVVLDEFTFDKSTNYDWLQDGFMGFLNDLTAYGEVKLFISSNNPLEGLLTDPVTGKPDRSDGLPNLASLFKERGTSRLIQLVTPIHLTGPNRRLH